MEAQSLFLFQAVHMLNRDLIIRACIKQSTYRVALAHVVSKSRCKKSLLEETLP